MKKKVFVRQLSPFRPASHPAKTFSPLGSCVISQNKSHVHAVKKEKKGENISKI